MKFSHLDGKDDGERNEVGLAEILNIFTTQVDFPNASAPFDGE